MNATQSVGRRLGLVLACGILACAVSTSATKPPKPPPEPPPPAGPAYWIVAVDGAINPWAISDSGALVGSAWYEYDGGGFQTPAALPPQIVADDVQYPGENLWLLPDVDGEQAYGDCFAMNEALVAVGYVNDTGCERAILWSADGAAVDLGVDPAGLGAMAIDINDAGLVLVGIGYDDEPDEGGGVVVPLDVDDNGEPDTWYADGNNDGINDLFFRTDTGHILLPLVVNEAGQVLASQFAGGDPVAGYLLTPDFTDADGDGNPWFADVDPVDGFNDLLVALEPPVPGDSVVVAGLNNLGQVAGHSGGHAVRWEFVEGGQIITDLGTIADKAEMTATGISDGGILVGTSRIPTGRRSKAGPSWLVDGDTLYELLPLVINADGWSELEAEGVNRFGWIHGRGYLDGVRRGFVAIPVGQP